MVYTSLQKMYLIECFYQQCGIVSSPLITLFVHITLATLFLLTVHNNWQLAVDRCTLHNLIIIQYSITNIHYYKCVLFYKGILQWF